MMLNEDLIYWMKSNNEKELAIELAEVQRNYIRAMEDNLFQHKGMISEKVLGFLNLDLVKAKLQLKALEEAAR